mgnify:CR=1 FL=1
MDGKLGGGVVLQGVEGDLGVNLEVGGGHHASVLLDLGLSAGRQHKLRPTQHNEPWSQAIRSSQ